MVDSVVGIKPRAVQLKVWFGITSVLEKKGSSQFLDTSPALQRLTCAWKEDWNLRIHFPKETIKSVDTLSSASSLCHQETVHAQSSRSIQKAPMCLQCCMSSKKTASRSLPQCSLSRLAWTCPGDRLVVPRRSLNGITDEACHPSLRIKRQLLPGTVVETPIPQLNTARWATTGHYVLYPTSAFPEHSR